MLFYLEMGQKSNDTRREVLEIMKKNLSVSLVSLLIIGSVDLIQFHVTDE